MKRKILVVIISLFVVLNSSVSVFADEKSYSKSLAKTNAMIDYLNEVYLDKYPELGFEIDYCSEDDIELLTALANYITQGCSTDEQKAKAIYDWMITNISYGMTTNSFSPIDVYKNREGLCSGQAQLMSTLFRVSGIPAAIVRASKQGTKEIESFYWSNYYINKKQHEFVMAYVDGGWYGYDSCWQWHKMKKEWIADQYVVLHVDGIMTYSEEAWTEEDDNVYSKSTDAWYRDGEFVCMTDGEIAEGSTATMQLGGCLSYVRQFYNRYTSVYYICDTTETNEINHTFAGGYYLPQYVKTQSVLRVKSNGVLDNDFYYYNGELYFRYVKIGNCIPDLGLTNNKINMYVGESIDFSSIYPGAYLSGAAINNIYKNTNTFDSSMFSFNGTTITANKVGEGAIKVSYGKKIYTIDVQVIDYVGDELTQTLCDHDHIHTEGDKEICSYCGKEIIEEEEVVEEPTEEIVEETPAQEEIVEDGEEIEIKEEVVEEIPVEETVEEVIEETVEEVIEEEVQETVEETIEEEVVEEIEEPEIVEEVVEEPETVEEVVETVAEEPVEEPEITLLSNNLDEEQPEEVIEETSVEEEVVVVEEEIIEPIIEEVKTIAPVVSFSPEREVSIDPIISSEVIEEKVVETKETIDEKEAAGDVVEEVKDVQITVEETSPEQPKNDMNVIIAVLYEIKDMIASFISSIMKLLSI